MLVDMIKDPTSTPRLHQGVPRRSAGVGRPRAAQPAGPFRSALCAVDLSANSRAAYDQAVLLTAPGGTVERVPAARLTRRRGRALRDACGRHDLVALGASAAACAVVQHAAVPVLIARWCAPGTDVTDTILVPVDDSPASRRAVDIAGRLAGARGGTVAILPSPAGEPALRRAIAAGSRVLLQATGAVPAIAGEQLPREQAIPAAAAALEASLVVLGVEADADAKRTAAQLAERIACSVLAVPAAGPSTSRRFTRERRREPTRPLRDGPIRVEH